MKQINLIVEDNRKSIDDTLEVVPDLTKNIEAISGEISHDIAAFRDSVDNVAETAGSVTDTLKKNKGAIEALSSFLHTVSVGKVLYDKYFKEKVDDVKDAADAVQETMDEAEH
jgi:methyl-accepting chemotaxis protein